MTPIKVGHEKPVNLISARLLWAVPWWSKIPEEVKEAIADSKSKKTIEDWFDVMKPPPMLNGGAREQILDRRGSIFNHYVLGTGIVTGFSRTTRSPGRNAHIWWVKFGEDDFIEINLGAGGRGRVKEPTPSQAYWCKVKNIRPEWKKSNG